jgi:hypothetical protein
MIVKKKLNERYALLTPSLKTIGDENILLDERDIVRKIAQWMYLFDLSKDRHLPVWEEHSRKYDLETSEDAIQWCYKNPKKAPEFLKGVLNDVALHISLVKQFAS